MTPGTVRTRSTGAGPVRSAAELATPPASTTASANSTEPSSSTASTPPCGAAEPGIGRRLRPGSALSRSRPATASTELPRAAAQRPERQPGPRFAVRDLRPRPAPPASGCGAPPRPPAGTAARRRAQFVHARPVDASHHQVGEAADDPAAQPPAQEGADRDVLAVELPGARVEVAAACRAARGFPVVTKGHSRVGSTMPIPAGSGRSRPRERRYTTRAPEFPIVLAEEPTSSASRVAAGR